MVPVLVGLLIGFMFGGIVGNATFGPHGALVGCVLGALVGGGIMATLNRAAKKLDEQAEAEKTE